MEGDTVVAEVVHMAVSASTATLNVCLDSSQTRVIDENNNDVTPERETPTLVRVEFLFAGQIYITSSSTVRTGSC